MDLGDEVFFLARDERKQKVERPPYTGEVWAPGKSPL